MLHVIFLNLQSQHFRWLFSLWQLKWVLDLQFVPFYTSPPLAFFPCVYYFKQDQKRSGVHSKFQLWGWCEERDLNDWSELWLGHVRHFIYLRVHNSFTVLSWNALVTNYIGCYQNRWFLCAILLRNKTLRGIVKWWDKLNCFSSPNDRDAVMKLL